MKDRFDYTHPNDFWFFNDDEESNAREEAQTESEKRQIQKRIGALENNVREYKNRIRYNMSALKEVYIAIDKLKDELEEIEKTEGSET